MNTTKPYWTPDEFLRSGECPYGRTVLYRLLNEEKIPSIRNGRSFVIPKTAWRRYLDTCGGQRPAEEPMEDRLHRTPQYLVAAR